MNESQNQPSRQIERVEKTIVKTGGFARFLATLFFGILIGVGIAAFFNSWLSAKEDKKQFNELQKQVEELHMQMGADRLPKQET
ncbi:hypothetical protein COU77_04395 [Candidatus Peregrinibacteria bacterium CG10_big_fil_rev_8_21_14_0_10_49_16]|nr:MAG: hypothetical protein COW95_00210 [Candidatus Peregrinibacteria bacterium CG22_combo_CG10-13_8_21_14_all_49_11]PIR51691.1 MAG: hypothetical protein COU77_04395 [Candidatus Peregrinibacteria bacterium CG10_big_fil_rev_8_21_14_0_10_49_16]